MPVPQITAHVLPATKKKFKTYAREQGLDTSELAKLLIMRERRLSRLFALTLTEQPHRGGRQPRGLAVGTTSITAHLASIHNMKKFDAYARKCGLSRSKAAAWLIETELNERWLERALSTE